MKKQRILILIIIIFIFNLFICIELVKEKKNVDKKENNQEEVVTIPKVSFWGNLSDIPSKKEKRKIIIKYESDSKSFESYALIKLQGTSSLAYEKKNYTIEFYNDENYSKKRTIDVGLGGAQSIYCLKANWIDKTHSRNIITARIMSQIQEKYNLFEDTPNNGLIDGFPVEIYLNGDFLGLYTWNIPKDAWMFNMDKDNENHIVFAAEGWDRTNLFKEEADYESWKLEVGNEDDETLSKLNRLIEFVDNSDDEIFKKEFNNYLNFDATINYLIMMEFAGLNDNVAKNMLLVTYDGEVWYPSLYDLDTSWGTTYNGSTTNEYSKMPNMIVSKLWEKIINNYSYEIAQRYFELREDILTKENVMNEFISFYKFIPEETLLKESERWDDIPGYDLNQIEEFLDTRITLVDALMNERLEK